jgi:hypothetical protein
MSLMKLICSIFPGRCASDTPDVAGGRPQIAPDLRVDPADEYWEPALGAPRIQGELFKLGFEVRAVERWW